MGNDAVPYMCGINRTLRWGKQLLLKCHTLIAVSGK
jgi:hypothetical protein